MSDVLDEVECPGCGTRSRVPAGRRDASLFCLTCDYPLFWALGRAVPPPGAESADDGAVRRLPGTAGRATLASLPCPVCNEHNAATATLCLRCGADLVPPVKAIVPEQRPPEPAPEPQPEPVAQVWWPWLLGAAAVLGALVLLALLTWA